ncbi:MAG TPA: BamA/TamA family outer membrane protein, partial [Anaeromyxobacteraceae bacterium]|nr:BamA/TamA family outer membrane protein [Anaeromyxobacteraceae bacterium]
RTRPLVLARETWDPPLWDEAAQRVVEAYRGEGYLEAAHEGTRAALDAAAGTVDLELRFREGVQTRVRAVAFQGNAEVTTADLSAAARLAPGDPLSYGAVEATRAALLGLYGKRGHLYARVVDAEELSADRREATVMFRIEEGPRVRVGSVVVAGARRTREDVVLETVALRAGDVYDPDAAARSQAALLRLGAFRSVGLRLSDPEVPATSKDLTVDIAERPWRTVSQGFGFSLANGPRAVVELVQPNVSGRALQLTARGKVNYPLVAFRPDLEGKRPIDRIEGRADVGLHDPRFGLFGARVGARVDGIAEQAHRRAYDLTRGSMVFGLDIPAARAVTLSLQYELEGDNVHKSPAVAGLVLTRADIESRRLPDGFTALQSFRPVIALDLRDDPLRPRRGWFLTGTTEYAHSIGSSTDGILFGLLPGSSVFVHMLKLSANATGYLPAGTAVLAVSLRAGRVFPLDPASQTIGPKRFFLGGAATMRGYGEEEMIPEDVRANYLEQVRTCAASLSGVACSGVAQQLASGQTLVSEGGEAFALGKFELRVPVRDTIEMGLFADVGNLWLDPHQLGLNDLRANIGFGLHFASPIGPVVFDLGFNLSPDPRLGEKVAAPHFSIGVF